MSYGTRWLSALGFELAYFGGAVPLLQRACGGAGIILKFERVRPARSDNFQPLKSREITPRFLDRTIRALKRWPIDIIGMDEVARRAVAPRVGRRFVALSFDGGTRDFVDFAYPLLAAHEVPFTVYLPTAFADGLGEMWWLALESVIASHDRISVMIDHRQRHFDIVSAGDKYRAFHYLESWMTTLAPSQLAVATDDLCLRYSVDVAALTRAAAMTWDDVAQFASNPLAGIGTSTVNYPRLANLQDTAAAREIAMGQAVATSALPDNPRHFAYPFGDRGSFDQRHVAMAAKAGLTSAVTAIPGVVHAGGRSHLHALPRLAWDGRLTSQRALRVMLSGVMLGAGRGASSPVPDRPCPSS